MTLTKTFTGFGMASLLLMTAAVSAQESKCPVMGGSTTNGSLSDRDWWPNQLNLRILHQNSPAADPMGDGFDYATEFKQLDLQALKNDVTKVLTTSQDWWPADYGHYGPFMIRLAWHSAGTYRVTDGRGGASDGTIRFAPLNSWPDNGNLDKARRLLWPVKKKYGRKISWADLIIFAGNCALEDMGFKTFGFAGGREDVWEPQGDVFWGPETEWLGDKRYKGERELDNPLAAVQMGLIYVNPQGPNGKPDPVAAARDIRETFGRMAMNDEETVALIAGGHTFGKAHGAASPDKNVGPEPEGEGIAAQGFGWLSKYKSGKGVDTITSGLEGAWTSTPTEWSNGYFENLFEYEWELTKSPAGAWQWTPKENGGKGTVPDAHDKSKSHAPMMFTTDLSLRMDPAYEKISKKFHDDPEAFETAFAKAWYKLTHRDMGPVSRCLGEWTAQPQVWQDPVPAVAHKLIDENDATALKKKILESGLTPAQLVSTAWASASTFRQTDKRGGANGARIRLAPQKDWAVNKPKQLAMVLKKLESVRNEFAKDISMADMIVLAGCAGVEAAAKKGGHEVTVPFRPGRTDATEEMTDATSFAVLEPKSDGFRNYQSKTAMERPAEELLIDRAHKLSLSAPEMSVLVAGMRSMGTNAGGGPMAQLGLLTKRPGALTNDFFVNLVDMSTMWQKSDICEHFFEGKNRETGEVKWTASRADLVFGSNSQLRAIAEAYACDDAQAKFVKDFVAAWTKVMELDRFDLKADKATKVARR